MKAEVTSCESGQLKFGCENEGRDWPSDSMCEVSETGSGTLLCFQGNRITAYTSTLRGCCLKPLLLQHHNRLWGSPPLGNPLRSLAKASVSLATSQPLSLDPFGCLQRTSIKSIHSIFPGIHSRTGAKMYLLNKCTNVGLGFLHSHH